MIKTKNIVFLGVLLVAACGVEPEGEQLFGLGGEAGAAGAAGMGGEAGADAGAAGMAGAAGAPGDGSVDVAPDTSGPCGPLMLLFGSVCVDKQPALHGDGSQGSAVPFSEAVTICEARGARLCTQDEREGACPGGPEPTTNGANHFFCNGPDLSWEWSDVVCPAGRCRSPCCNGGPTSLFHCPENACDVTAAVSGFRCCRNL